jgi:hypothetical protein
MAQKSIDVKLFHIRYKREGDSYPHEYISPSKDLPRWLQAEVVDIFQVTPITRHFDVGDFVWTWYCGAWRPARVTGTARTRVQVRFAPRKGMSPNDPNARVRWVSAHHLRTTKSDMEGHDI